MDAAGNVGAASDELNVTIDTQAPSKPENPSLDSASDTVKPEPLTGTTRQVEVVLRNDSDKDSTIAAKVDVSRTTQDGKKVDSVTLSESKTEEVLDKLTKDNKVVSIYINDLPKDSADEVAVNVSAKSLGKLQNADSELQIKTEQVTIDLPKETVKALSEGKDDLYFRLTPLQEQTERQEAVKNALQASVVMEAVGGGKATALGTLMTIETNYQNQNTKITFSLKDVAIPKDPAQRKEFLSSLAVYIEHSDGKKVLDKGRIVYDTNGEPVGIEIELTKFSSFMILSVDNDAPSARRVKITGIAKEGSKLIAVYTYHDLDQDKQGKTVYQWYRSDDSKGTKKKVIKGANKAVYTVTKQDAGKYLFVAITPTANAGVKKGIKATVSTRTSVPKQKKL